MELETKSIYHPLHIGFFVIGGLGSPIYLFMMVSPLPLWKYFFWFPIPWVMFWAHVHSRYIDFDTLETTDEGIIIRHQKKNWLTSRIKNVSIPWEHLLQILAIVGVQNKYHYCHHYLVLLDGTMLNIPVPEENYVVHEIAERFAQFLHSTHGQNVVVIIPPLDPMESTIIVSRIGNLYEISETIRTARKRLFINDGAAFFFFLIFVIVMLAKQIEKPSVELGYLVLSGIALLLLYCSILQPRYDGIGMNQKYFDTLLRVNSETTMFPVLIHPDTDTSPPNLFESMYGFYTKNKWFFIPWNVICVVFIVSYLHFDQTMDGGRKVLIITIFSLIQLFYLTSIWKGYTMNKLKATSSDGR